MTARESSGRDAARILALALTGDEPTGEEAARFEDAMQLKVPALEAARDRALWRLMLRGPGWARLVDAGLAFADPVSPVRHRVCLMLAILEASPHHARRFLPSPWGPFTLLEILATGAAGVLRVAAGLVVVNSHGRLWR